MNPNILISRPLILSLAFTASLDISSAASYYWKGGTGNWTTTTLWSDIAAGGGAGGTPGSGDTIYFNTTPANSLASTISLNGDRSVNGIVINTSGKTTISGGTATSILTLGTGGITISGTGAVDIGTGGSVPIRMTGSQTWTNNSTGTFWMGNSIAPTTAVTTPTTLTIDGTGTTWLAYAINNGGAGATVSLVKNGAGTLDLTSTTAGTYSGGTTFNGGTVIASIDGNLGASGGLTFGGGTLRTTSTFSMGRSITLNSGGGTLEVASGTVLTENGVVSGSGGLVKTGAGTLVLSNANTYTGGTTINQGILQISQTGTTDNRLGGTSSGITLNGGTLQATGTSFMMSATRAVNIASSVGVIDVVGAMELRVDGAITGNTLEKTGAGTLYLVGTNKTYTGGTILSGGTILIFENNRLGAATSGLTFNGGTLRTNGSITMNRATTLNSGGGTLSVDATMTLTQEGLVSGSGVLTKTGPGTLVLKNNANSFTGNLVIGGGALTVDTLAAANGTTSALGNLTTAGRTITVNSGGTLNLNINNALNNGTAPAATLVINGGTVSANRYNSLGAVTLSNGGTLTNATSDSGNFDGYAFLGTVTVEAGGTTASTISTTNGDSNHLAANTSFVIADVTGSSAADLVISAGLRNQFGGSPGTAGGLTKSGAGTMALTAANTYTGTTTISAGILQIGNGGTTGSLSTSGAIVNNANLTFNRTNTLVQGTDFSTAAITGTGSLTKAGSGVLTLNAANTYSGGTTVTAGTLYVNNTTGSGTGSGALVVNAGTLLGGSGIIGGAATINGSHSAGVAAINNGIGTQTFSSSLSYATGSSFSWDLGGETTTGKGTNFDSVVVNGSMSVDNAVFKVVVSGLNLDSSFWASNKTWSVFETGAVSGGFSAFELYDASNILASISYGSRGSFSFASNGQLSWTVPEPSNALAGLLLAAGLLRRRRTPA